MTIKVAILDDHISIIDGYMYRLSKIPEIEVVVTGMYGDELESLLARHPVDVLILDINLPTSSENHNPFPVLHILPHLFQQYPELNILVISMLSNQHALIEALVDAGVSGYVLKDDHNSIQQLGKIITVVANGGIYFSEAAYRDRSAAEIKPMLTARQLEALSLCAAFPDSATINLAGRLGISGSTLRNLLSGAYLRLGVRTRAAAIVRAQQLGLLPSTGQMPVKQETGEG